MRAHTLTRVIWLFPLIAPEECSCEVGEEFLEWNGCEFHLNTMILFAVVVHCFTKYGSLLFRFLVEAVREAPIDPRVRHLILRRLFHRPVEYSSDHES